MIPRWRWRAFRLAERPVEVSLVTTTCLAEIVAEDARDRKAAQDAQAAKDARDRKDGKGPRDAQGPNVVKDRNDAKDEKKATDAKGLLERLSRDEALRLFDGCCREPTFALRAFIRDNGGEPSLLVPRERDLVSYVRQEIAVGALVAIRPARERQRLPLLTRRAAPAPEPAPIPIRRAPPPPPAAEPEAEGPEFMCPGPQAEALIAAAQSGAPFCAECARAAAARAAGGAPARA